MFRNAIEQRLAELRRLWREYCEQFAEYENALEAFEQRTESMPHPREPVFPEELGALTCGAKTRRGTPCKRGYPLPTNPHEPHVAEPNAEMRYPQTPPVIQHVWREMG